MKWRKIKHLFVANNHSNWMFSHAANPVFTNYDSNLCRIYFSCRDKLSRSHIAFIDVDFEDDFRIKAISYKPVLSPGELGMFDDSGTVMSCFVNTDAELYLFYLGWNLKMTVPWLNSIGLAKFNMHSKKFEKVSKAPIMDRSHEDPFTISYPFVLYDNGVYRMWYGSNLRWGKDQKDMKHVFKYAESYDCKDWSRSNKIVVNHKYNNEYALSKPWVMKEDGIYKMWYSYRGNGKIDSYRIGYAVSIDGINWDRMDEKVGIDVSENGWDSEMISYPCVFNYKNRKFMLYTGNGYGIAGFGIAVLEE